jgi:hypothetical protein
MKNQYYLICFLLLAISSQAQIATFGFENTLFDDANALEVIYLDYGVTSDDPNYSQNEGNTHIMLDSTQGLMFPKEINTQIDTSKSFEMEFTFNVTEVGYYQGFMFLYTNQYGVNSNGFSIFVRHDIFSEVDDYEVVFTYADGGFEQGIPDHPGHDETRIGFFNQGEEVHVQLILDFENNQWSSIANGKFTKAFFDPAYNFNSIKSSIVDNESFMGWTLNQDFDMEFDPSTYTSSAYFDDVSFYSPRKPGNASLLSTALVEVTDHIKGISMLTPDELQSNLGAIFANYNGSFEVAEAEILDYISTYEAVNEPVFIDRELVTLSSLSAETQILIFLQQAIFDDQIVPGNIEKYEGFKYEFADIFPGKVAADAPRVQNAIVDVNGSYSIIQGARIAADLELVKRPTGYYAAPGEIISISIPSGLVNEGLVAMIGAHDSDHSTLTHTNRYVRISKDFPLDAETVNIVSPFGGSLYIKSLEGKDLGWFEITIDGAVKSPYFSFRTDRVTPLEQWQSELAEENVLWVDIESDKYMMTLPLNHVKDLTDPTELMQNWNSIMDGFNYVGGRPSERTRSEYFLVDSRLPSDAFGTGYPQVIGDNNAPYGFLGSTELYPTQILNPNFWKSGFSITLHEMGHGALHPTLIREVESIVHLNAVYIYNQQYDLPLDSAFKYSAFELLIMDEAAVDWMIADNFRNNKEMSCDPTMPMLICDEVRYQHRGHAKYIQLADLFGWEAVHGMNKFFYDKWTASVEDLLVSSDQMIFAASEAVGYNVAPLMHFWGLQPSAELAEQLSTMPKSSKILELLEHYKEIAPKNEAEFQQWYDRNYLKKGPPHYDRYDLSLAEFDSKNYGPSIQEQIDYLIKTYFPAASIETKVLSFTFAEQTKPATIDTLIQVVDVEVAFGTDLTSLAPEFEVSTGAVVYIGNLIQTSGVTINDYTDTVTYKIVAEDTTQSSLWKVVVAEALSSRVSEEGFDYSDVLISPNPSFGQISLLVKGSARVDVQVYDMNGRKVFDQRELKGPQITIDWEGNPGPYILKINTEKKTGAYRIMRL